MDRRLATTQDSRLTQGATEKSYHLLPGLCSIYPFSVAPGGVRSPKNSGAQWRGPVVQFTTRISISSVYMWSA